MSSKSLKVDAAGELFVYISWFPGSACGTATGGSASSWPVANEEAEPPVGQSQAEPGIEDTKNMLRNNSPAASKL